MMNKELYNEALEALKNDDDLFVDMVQSADNWSGYADGFRAFPMDELDDLFCDIKLTDFLDKITSDFDRHDAYFVDTIYGIDSTDDIVALYRDNVFEDELLDYIIDKIDVLDFWGHEDFQTMIEAINQDDEEA